MTKPQRTRKVEFRFDERSLVPLEKLYPPGTPLTEIVVRDPATGKERTLLIPMEASTR